MRHGGRPFGEARVLEQPHGAVPDDRRRVPEVSGEGGARRRADVEPHPVGRYLPDGQGADRTRVRSRGRAVVRGELQTVGMVVEELRGLGDPVALDEGPAGRELLRGSEGVGHRSSDQHPVGASEQGKDDRQLVRDLGAAEDGHEGAGRVPERQAQRLELRLQQRTGRGARKAAGAGVHRGVRPVGGPEGVVHVLVPVGRQRRRELGCVPRFSRVEPQVLEQNDLSRPEFGRIRARIPSRPRLEADRVTQELLEPLRDGAEAERGVRHPARPSQMGGDHDRRSHLARGADRRQGGPEAAVVRHPPVREGRVQVGAEE